MDFPGIKKGYMEQLDQLENKLSQIRQHIAEATEQTMLDSEAIDKMIKNIQNNLVGLEKANRKGDWFLKLCDIQLKANELGMLLAPVEEQMEFNITVSNLTDFSKKIEDYISGNWEEIE